MDDYEDGSELQSESTHDSFEMRFEPSTIKHLGLQMYSTLPPVIGELVSNAWDAGATEVDITVPTTPVDDESEISIEDDGIGMTPEEVESKYLVVGRDRRIEERDAPILVDGKARRIMGRKGIGKFSGFGVAGEFEIESATIVDDKLVVSRFVMNYEELMKKAKDRKIVFPRLPASRNATRGTRVTLREIRKYRNRSISLGVLRRSLARQFSVIGEENSFVVRVNGDPITVDERDLKRLLDKDTAGHLYLWTYEAEEIEENTGWTVSGWIGTLDPSKKEEDLQRGVVIMARGKMVQSPFFFNHSSGQPYAFSYVVGEIHAEFVDTLAEDSIGTTRASLVWDTPANEALLRWGKRQLSRVDREWSAKRKQKNEVLLERSDHDFDLLS